VSRTPLRKRFIGNRILGFTVLLLLAGVAIAPFLSDNVSATAGFPTIIDTTHGNAGGVTAPTIYLPRGASIGNLFIMCNAYDVGTTITYPSGWYKMIADTTIGGGGQVILSCAYRFADGTEGLTVSITWSASTHEAYVCYLINNNKPNTVPGSVISPTIGNNANPDPPLLTRVDSYDRLWIAVTGWFVSKTLSTYPSGYVNGITDNNGFAPAIAMASKDAFASSEDPGTFTLTGTTGWAATTFSILPASMTFQAVIRDTPNYGAAPLTVQFNVSYINNAVPVYFEWRFGDSTSSENTNKDPSHIYVTPGIYKAEFYITDGTTYLYYERFITVVNSTNADCSTNPNLPGCQQFNNNNTNTNNITAPTFPFDAPLTVLFIGLVVLFVFLFIVGLRERFIMVMAGVVGFMFPISLRLLSNVNTLFVIVSILPGVVCIALAFTRRGD
jgi:hypothetical protein